MLRCSTSVIVALVCLTCSLPAFAHRPTISDGTAINAESALPIDDITISQVVYHEITEAAPQLWLKFQANQGQELYWQLGLPYIDRLENYRPAVALLGPGLPDAPPDLAFDVPAGLGAQVWTMDDVTDPEVFHEPFSNTTSWIIREQTVELPAAGEYFLVAYVPTQETGKLWLAVGRREVFTLTDIAGLSTILPQVRDFHETTADGGLPCFGLPAAAVALGFALFSLSRRC
jgi:hypothetical protein